MASAKEAAAKKILDGFKQSNRVFDEHLEHDENTLRTHSKLSGQDREHANNVNAAVSQLIDAVGTDIGHSMIISNPKLEDQDSRIYEFAVFGEGILGYVKFQGFGPDPEILVKAVPRSSITEIEVRASKDYRNDEGSQVFVAKYRGGIALEIRERDIDGLNASASGSWMQELLESLRKDLASA